jgi:transposase
MYRRYDKAFRQQAIKMVTEQGCNPSSVARDLGMPHSTLFKWIKDDGWSKPDSHQTSPSDDVAALKAQIGRLQAQVKDLETDREILKKATAFFANQSK